MSDPAPTASGGATVEFQNVTKHYEQRERGPGAVNDLSLTVPAGKICVLVGPSGCGKTTSLKMVNRLIEPSDGRILIDGRDISREDPIALRRRIGYVIQQTGLFPHLRIGENVAVVPRLLGWDRKRQRDRTDELLDLVGLEAARYRDRFPSQLSGGERQRVGVARALAADPPVMLMDEPFGAVDPIVRERLQNEFLRLQEQLAKTILFVTHDIDEAIKMGDLVAVMEVGGILAQFGPPDEVLAAPASDFVARFVGADRGLKRLSLTRVGELDMTTPVMARPGTDAAEARQRTLADPFGYLLLVDADERPIGWIDQEEIPKQGTLSQDLAIPMSPLVSRRTTLKDALSMMLASDVFAAIVVDRTGRVLGLVTMESLGGAIRSADSASHDSRDGIGADEARRLAAELTAREDAELGEPEVVDAR
ncbi:MAG: ABC transporter ATP-binding protein [Candidatus Limnocylindrales bacterium]